MFKLTPRINHELCSGTNKCIAESKRNNDFECVKCEKVIARFKLKYITFEDVMNEPKKYYLNVNKMKICSADNKPFDMALEHSYLLDKTGQVPKNSEKNISEAYKESGPLVFESGLLPMDFDIENLYLRESETNIYYYTQEPDSFLLICLALIALVIFGFLLVITNFIYIFSKSKFSKLFFGFPMFDDG